MRVRAMSAAGDYQFGQGSANYLVNSPAAVGQLAYSRLRLIEGEWFAATGAGLNVSNILGKNSKATYDLAYRDCISGTQGFADFAKPNGYFSNLNGQTRALTVSATIDTVYSASIGAPGLAANQTTVTATVFI